MASMISGALRRGLDALTHRVVYTLLLALTTLAVVVLVVPPMREVSGTNEQVIGTAVTAVLLVELVGSRLRRFVDWLLYGQRGDAAEVSERLAAQLEAGRDQAVPALVAALADTLRLTFVAASVQRPHGAEVVATVGAPGTGRTARVPVRHGGRLLGELCASRRNEPLDRQDERMLRAAAAQLGVVLHAASLAAELQRARERLVASREDERRRLRRELHDGVGPTLAGIALGLESSHRALATDLDRAAALLAETREDVVQLVADVRRVVDGLRPPLLDEVGLTGALTQLATMLSARAGCAVEVRATGELPDLAAAVEVAAYRIGAEALTNVVRHADATHCVVSLEVAGGCLVLEVADDGTGGAAAREGGTGLPSVAERAGELGGDVEVTSSPGGTCLRARLPLGPVTVHA